MPSSQGALGRAVEPCEDPARHEAIKVYIESLVTYGDPTPGPV